MSSILTFFLITDVEKYIKFNLLLKIKNFTDLRPDLENKTVFFLIKEYCSFNPLSMFQLNNKQIGIIKVVKNKKSTEILSIPNK